MNLGGLFELDNKVEREKEINDLMISPAFWDDREKADKLMIELKSIKSIILNINELTNSVDDALSMLEESNNSDICSLLEDELSILKDRVDKLELETYLNGKYDNSNAIMEIHAGAGGTESCDWVSMLYRMYIRYTEKNGYNTILLDKQDGEEAGIKSIMFQINGNNAYGYLKGERGVHRLVRISPFDSNKRRHTSFAAVDVIPEINNDIDININDNDIRIDIYRSSGPGGQGVNTTDSAVRITHIPTGIVVTCQNERSQIRNKEKALEVLKSKLYSILLQEQKEEVSDIRGEIVSNGFGSAKRSYVMQPYRLVKDNDSGYERSNVDDILNGEISEMLESNFKCIKELIWECLIILEEKRLILLLIQLRKKILVRGI